MTQCANEQEFPTQGHSWTPPVPVLAGPLESDRILVRSFSLEDIPQVVETIRTHRAGLLPWMPWANDDVWTPAQAGKFITEQIISLENPSGFQGVGLGIFEKSTGEFLGGSGVHGIRRDTASCETGYWIRDDRRGTGLAGEACALTLSWALSKQPDGLGLRRVRVYCAKDNTASVRVLQKLGLRQEVEQRQDYFVPGYGVTDRIGFGVMDDEWDCKEHRLIEA